VSPYHGARRDRRAGGNRGFTLAELIAVLVIAAILAVSATVLFSRGDFDAAAFADRAQNAISYARKVAIAQRRSVSVVIAGNTLSVCYDSGNCATTLVEAPAGPSTGMSYAAPAGVAISDAQFSFSALGAPTFVSGPMVGGNLQITVSGGVSSVIIVEQQTGYVHL
jgi:MSHA pilin protein MshC